MKKGTILIIFLIIISSCKSHLNKSQIAVQIPVETPKLEIPQTAKSGLDSLVAKVATTNGCRMTATIKGPNTTAYYSGFDGRTNEKITDFNDLYEIGSCTKMFTAASIFQLIEQKKLKLDDYLTAVLPNETFYDDLLIVDSKNYIDSVKVINLLNHTSGFPEYFLEDEEKVVELHSDPSELFTAEKLINMAKANPDQNVFIPGSKFSYCNVNYILLGLIIEKLSKQTYPEYIQEHIIAPLALKNTYLGSIFPNAKRPKGHYKDKITLMPLTMAGAAGEIISNLDDMQTFITAWNKGKLFKDLNTINSIKNDYFNDMVPGAVTYGAGVVNLMNLSLGHGGQTLGYQSYVGTMSSNNYTFVFSIDDATVSAWYPAIETSTLLNSIK
ncbi:serine hydrolase domain-containing protein [Tamlana sp. 2_MG-2023]|uniref:serine hydrolase domain-containing protein n=1 Tax=unclassified Tamlana TaxID=2614803 RepID=UPI0026E32D83|nr:MULTISPECIES: serine hydrolase domain-containing protein [unclassified Tamlana]MDO6759129.1 serine hydrolase domain-containing protein [Tamlana sp. 2_MG-2023]MDO6789828.1 serine hydrolase domain-containing protein [Tamlana sp. 1_MG-2023]